jgi:NADPH-dependent F420 reductase
VKIAILGGTGSFGRALAIRLAARGEDEIVIGSRDAERAQETASELGGGAVSGATNEDAVRGADLVVLAVKADAALDTARDVADALGETPVFSVASALSFSKDGVRPDPDARSIAERVQDIVRGPVTAGLHSIAAANLDDAPPEEDALVCGDDPHAKELALQLAGKVVAGRALDAGPLASARALEGLTAVIVNLNKRYKAHAGIRVSGVSTE